MQTTIEWIEDVHFKAQADSQHTVLIDGPPDAGGKNRGARPMELMLMGVGGCTSFDVVNILTKARQDIRKFVTRITAERAADIPQVFEHINIHFDIEGTGIDAKRVQRAIDLTADKYCSASIMMVRAGAQVSHTFTISEPAG